MELAAFVTGTLLPWVSSFAEKYPWVFMVFTVMAVARSVFKPLMGVVQAYVMATPTPKDDEWLAKVMASKWYKAIVWIVDYIFSLKLPKIPKK